jgi:uncharacterized heparinase superfamily protein
MSSRIDACYRQRAATLGPVRFDHPQLARVAELRLGRRCDEERLRTAEEAIAGRFSFLGRQEEMGCSVDWHRPDLGGGTRLWKTLLHEFSYALDLAAAHRSTGERVYRDRLFQLVWSWEALSPIGCPGFALDAWNARAVATRLVNLTLAGSLLELRNDDEEAQRLGQLLARHALFLRENLEWDVRGNHLLRNAVGLVFAHEIVGGFEDALPLLQEQVVEQVLPDGCHIERVPLYHAIALQDLVEVSALLGASVPEWLRDAVGRMAGYLSAILHGDGDLPLFGDSWLGEVDPQYLLSAASELTSSPIIFLSSAPPGCGSGLIPVRNGRMIAIFRAGPHGPDYQLGHAHADLLSFELSRAATRVVTDTGTATYDPGEQRTHLRSTSAHNTLLIDGEEQMEAWGSFRVGRRGRARVLAQGSDDHFRWVWASHDAYGWLAGAPIHQRLLGVSEHVVLVFDAIDGGGTHHIESWLHLHPDLPAKCVRVVPLRGSVAHGSAPLHERFGQVRKMPELRVCEETVLPWVGGWLLLFGALSEGMGQVELRREHTTIRMRYSAEQLTLAASWDCAAPASLASVVLSLCTSARKSAT